VGICGGREGEGGGGVDDCVRFVCVDGTRWSLFRVSYLKRRRMGASSSCVNDDDDDDDDDEDDSGKTCFPPCLF